MQLLGTTCPACDAQVRVPPDQVRLYLLQVGDVEPLGGLYLFTCPSCEEVVGRLADNRITEVLLLAGVPVAEVTAAGTPLGDAGVVPRRSHPEDPPGGPPLTHDDLLDLHLLLEQPDWFTLLRG